MADSGVFPSDIGRIPRGQNVVRTRGASRKTLQGVFTAHVEQIEESGGISQADILRVDGEADIQADDKLEIGGQKYVVGSVTDLPTSGQRTATLRLE